MRFHVTCVLLVGMIGGPRLAAAQDWNTPEIRALIDRAIARRAGAVEDGGLTDYQATARGFVLFLTQLGSGFDAPPVLVKTDQLALEVYWQFPGRSKQRIVGWRDRMDLPTEIQYHRDHLGIVQNSFGDRIRLGDGHEVSQVPHPLSRLGPTLYDYAAVDSVAMTLEDRTLQVVEVRVRPRDPAVPAVVGSIFLDATTAEVVRFRFSFTRAAYRDETVEDITVVLEQALWEGRYWLPREQQIEIRRRTGWLDFPARGIIRARWQIGDYRFNVGLSRALFAGREIEPAPVAVRDTFPWAQSLGDDLRAAVGPLRDVDLDAVRAEFAQVVSQRLLTGLPQTGVGGRGVSDLTHFNRVEGVALGVGGVLRSRSGAVEARGWIGYGLSDRRGKVRGSVRLAAGRWTLGIGGRREIRDFQDEPVISPLLNSFLAQEGGIDHGDYLLAEGADVGAETRWRDGRFEGVAGVERVAPVSVEANPAHGTFRANPVFSEGTFTRVGVALDLATPSAIGENALRGTVQAEVGRGGGESYGRIAVATQLQVGINGSRIVVRGRGGVGTRNLPSHRAFTLGGRGTIVGEPFRAWGGRVAAWGSAEWQFAVPVPNVGIGPVISSGEFLRVAPFIGVGWSGRPIPGMPFAATDGARPVTGLAIEWLRGLVRWELGWSIRDGGVRGAVDVRRDLWEIL